MRGSPSDPIRLTSRDQLLLLALVVFGALCLFLGFHLYPSVFPEATIHFQIDRKEARHRAENFLKEEGLSPAGYRYASAFQYDDSAKVFLEKELGLKAMDEAVEKAARIWRWSNRWFKPLQKEELQVDIAPTGELVRFAHLLAEEAPGERLTEREARQLAEASMTRLRPQGAEHLHYLGATTAALPGRTDYTFTWERDDLDWKGGRYRHRIRIQGDRFGGYEEFVQVPEAWARDYSRLRSKNLTASQVASIFMIGTLIAMLVVLIQQLRWRTIRWRFALGLGAAGSILVLLTSWNSLPTALFGYDTTRSYGGFVAEQLLTGLIQAVGLGLIVLVMTAAGEREYRSAFPGKIALPNMFTRRGMRTKEFFFSSLGGLVLTCFFLAYQTVFYRIAGSLGAWAPADVPYDDLLNSVLPWAFLLFIGFTPSVTEEFTFRIFSVPFLSKLFRVRILAIVLASFVWGFAHSAYPNQPFYIRGLEVGLAGVLMCVLMIRFNALVLLVWHYTVDALYSGYLLFRSGNVYYVMTAALAGGILVLPFVIALVSYLRTRHFTDPEALRHRSEPVRMAPLEESPVMARPLPEASPDARSQAVLQPAMRRGLLWAVGVSAATLVLVLALGANVKVPEPPGKTDRATALLRAQGFADAQGFDRAGAKCVVSLDSEMDPDAARYVLDHAGLAGFTSTWTDLLPVESWSVRFFRPLDPNEVTVRIDLSSGSPIGYRHRIAEADSLPPATPDEAETLARGLLASVNLDPAGMDIKEAADHSRPKRMDRSFAWEAPEGDPRNVGEARYRLEATVTGNRPGGFEKQLKVPEEYHRLRNRHTFIWPLALGLVLLGCAGILVIALRNAGRAHTQGTIPWRRLVRVGPWAALTALAATLNLLPGILNRYQTAIPWNVFMVGIVANLALAMVLYFLLGWAGAAMIHGLHPSVALLKGRAARRSWLPAAVLSFLLFPVWGRVLGQVRVLLAAWFPHAAPPPPVGGSAVMGSIVPALGSVTSVVVGTFLLALLLAGVAKALARGGRPGPRIGTLLVAAVAIGLAVLPARSVGEVLVNLAFNGLTIAAVWLLFRLLVQNNPLAVLTGVYGYQLYRSVGGLLEQPNAWARTHGVVAGVVLLLPIVWLVVDARRRVLAEQRSS